MICYSTNKFYSGLKIIFDREPCLILSSKFVKPGKGQAFNKVRFKKLISNKIIEKTFKSSHYVDIADIIDINLIYLYTDYKFWYFINNSTFEELAVDSKVIGDSYNWLKIQSEYTLTLWNKKPILITIPNFVELKIIKTEPIRKCDTIISREKLAILSTKISIKVPLFVKVGEFIKVDTRSGKYVSRIK